MRGQGGRVAAVLAVLVGAATLPSCTPALPVYSDLARDAEPGDEIPAEASASTYSGIVIDSIRRVAEMDEATVWLAAREPLGACLVVQSNDGFWSTACVDGTGPGGLTGPGGSFVFQPDGIPAPEGNYEQISENVYRLG